MGERAAHCTLPRASCQGAGSPSSYVTPSHGSARPTEPLTSLWWNDYKNPPLNSDHCLYRWRFGLVLCDGKLSDTCYDLSWRKAG
eukprot:3772059-Heterocapsa_arctica.AAC.1